MHEENRPESTDASSTIHNNDPVGENDAQLDNFYEMHQTDTKNTAASLHSSTQHASAGEKFAYNLPSTRANDSSRAPKPHRWCY